MAQGPMKADYQSPVTCKGWGTYSGSITLDNALVAGRIVRARFGSSGAYQKLFVMNSYNNEFMAFSTTAGNIQVNFTDATHITVQCPSGYELRDLVYFPLPRLI